MHAPLSAPVIRKFFAFGSASGNGAEVVVGPESGGPPAVVGVLSAWVLGVAAISEVFCKPFTTF